MKSKEKALGKLRKRVFHQLDISSNPTKKLSATNRFICAVILLGILVLVLGTEQTITEDYGLLLRFMELCILSIFIVEYILRLWVAPLNQKYSGRYGVVRFVTSPLALIDLATILPFIITGFGNGSFMLRMIRLARLISLAKFGRYSLALQNIFYVLHKKRYELLMSFVLTIAMVLISSTLLYLAEGRVQPDKFGSIPRATWWALITLTTVGYGDIYPVTVLGKVFAGMTAIAGISMIALPTGIIASAFNEAVAKKQN